jgi:hypothetical protein
VGALHNIAQKNGSDGSPSLPREYPAARHAITAEFNRAETMVGFFVLDATFHHHEEKDMALVPPANPYGLQLVQERSHGNREPEAEILGLHGKAVPGLHS